MRALFPDRHVARGRGFTLIEMVVVVAIVGILAAAAQPMLALAARRQKEFELHRALRSLRTAIDAYHQAALDGKILVDRKEDENGYPATLQLLADGVPSAASRDRRVYFLRAIPRDPFADTTLPAAQTWGLRSYESPPDAPRAGRDVFDVYSLTPGNGLDGQPYRSW
jgi:general secretion pathway protein G